MVTTYFHNKYKCSNCGWIGLVEQMTTSWECYYDESYGFDEFGSDFACPNCDSWNGTSGSDYRELDNSYWIVVKEVK